MMNQLYSRDEPVHCSVPVWDHWHVTACSNSINKSKEIQWCLEQTGITQGRILGNSKNEAWKRP